MLAKKYKQKSQKFILALFLDFNILLL